MNLGDANRGIKRHKKPRRIAIDGNAVIEQTAEAA